MAMSSMREWSMRPNPSPANQTVQAFFRDVYSLHGQEVRITSGFDKGRAGLVKGFCFRSAIVQIYDRPDEDAVIPVHMLSVIEPTKRWNRAQEQLGHSSSSPPSPSSALSSSPPSTAKERPESLEMTTPPQYKGRGYGDASECWQQLFMSNEDAMHSSFFEQPGLSVDAMAGCTIFEIVLMSHITTALAETVRQSVTTIARGQILRHGGNHRDVGFLDEAIIFDGEAGGRKLYVSAPATHDLWVSDVLSSLPGVEYVS